MNSSVKTIECCVACFAKAAEQNRNTEPIRNDLDSLLWLTCNKRISSNKSYVCIISTLTRYKRIGCAFHVDVISKLMIEVSVYLSTYSLSDMKQLHYILNVMFIVKWFYYNDVYNAVAKVFAVLLQSFEFKVFLRR